MSLEPVAWENAPSTATPLNATTLNQQQAYVKAQADAAASSAATAVAAAATATAPDDAAVSGLLINPATDTYAATQALIAASGDGAVTTVNTNWIPRAATYSTIEDKLTDWKAALAGTGLAQAVVVGDSILEGTGASTAENRVVNRLQTLLRYRTGRTIGAAWPYIPSLQNTDTPGFPVTATAGVILQNTYGTWHTANIPTGESLTFTFDGTSCSILYFKASASGKMRIVVDGGTAVVVDTNSVSNPPGANSAKWDSGALTAGAHTVVITRDATSTAGQNPLVHGLLTYDGDSAGGVRIIDASYHGIASSFMISGRNTHMASAIAAMGTVSLLIIAVGTNDYGAGTVPATYKTALTDFITAVRGAGFAGSVVLMNMYSNVTRDEDDYAQYGAKMREIAAADAKVSYFDLRLRMPDVPDPVTAAEGLGLFADALHPADKGNEWMAHVLADYLSLRA